MTSIWLRRGALACVVGALVLGACGGDDDDDVAADSGDATTTVAETTPPEEEPGDDPVVDDSTDDYVGLTVDEAGAMADEAGVPWRVVSEDGESLAVTMDFVENRVNFTVVDGVVTEVTTG